MSGSRSRSPTSAIFSDVPVIEVLVKAGDTVKAEDSLVTLESDKATMDVPAPSAGVVRELKVKVGDKVSEGSVILVIDAAGAAAAARRNRRLRPLPPRTVVAARPRLAPAAAAPAAHPSPAPSPW